MDFSFNENLKDKRCGKCDFLEQGFVFTKKEKILIEQNMTEVTFRKGESIAKQGTFSTDVFFVRSGLIKLYIENQNEKDFILKLIEPNNYIGLQLLDGINYYTFSVQALKSSLLCVVRKEIVEEIALNNMSFSRYINRCFIKDYEYLYGKLSNIASKHMSGRLAEALLYVSQEQFLEENIFQYITRRDLADIAGMSMESINKLLNEFKAASIIDTFGKKIKILDYIMLDKISKYG